MAVVVAAVAVAAEFGRRLGQWSVAVTVAVPAAAEYRIDLAGTAAVVAVFGCSFLLFSRPA